MKVNNVNLKKIIQAMLIFENKLEVKSILSG